jgi:hypothetical protein
LGQKNLGKVAQVFGWKNWQKYLVNCEALNFTSYKKFTPGLAFRVLA